MDVDEKQTEGQEPTIDIGARLCEARDNLGLDSEKIAKELNLAVEIITRIEQNIFHQEIPVAFIRGYVKAYSTKVGLDTPKVLAEFDTQTSGDAPSLSRVQSISKFDSTRRELNSNSFIIKSVSAIVILLFLSYGAYEVWKRFASNNDSNEIELAVSETGKSAEIDLGALANQPQSAQSNIDNSSANEAVTEASTELSEKQASDDIDPLEQAADGQRTKTQSTPPDRAIASTPEASSENSQAVGAVKQTEQNSNISEDQTTNLANAQDLVMTPLVLDFSADCWVRIVDARGEVIALGVKRAGKHMPIEGVKPFNVVLGDPSVVTLQYNNQDFDLSGYPAERRAEIILN